MLCKLQIFSIQPHFSKGLLPTRILFYIVPPHHCKMAWIILCVFLVAFKQVEACYYQDLCYCCPDFHFNNCNNAQLKDYPLFSILDMHQTINLYFRNNSLTKLPTLQYLEYFPNLKLIDLRNNTICGDFKKKVKITYLLTPCGKLHFHGKPLTLYLSLIHI